MKQSLSKYERLIIANQYDILAKLSDDEHERETYENTRDIFIEGFSKYYGLATEGFSEELTEVECTFVTDVLNMYSDLYFSRLKDNQAIEDIKESEVLFQGFDLNDEQEGKYLSFYRFLVEKLNRYSEFKKWIDEGKIEDFNSHGFGPSMNTLFDMIQTYKRIRAGKTTVSFRYLDLAEIKEILNS